MVCYKVLEDSSFSTLVCCRLVTEILSLNLVTMCRTCSEEGTHTLNYTLYTLTS